MKITQGTFVIIGVAILSGTAVYLTYAFVGTPKIQYQADVSASSSLNLVGKDLSDPNITNKNFADWQKLVATLGVGSSSSLTSTTTVTDKYAQDLFAQYMALKQNKGILTTDDENALIQKLVADADALASPARVYTIKDISTVKATPDTISAYRAALVAAFNKSNIPNDKNEIVLLNRIVQNGDKTAIPELDTPISVYKNLLSELLVLSVPIDIESSHLGVINAISRIIKDIGGFRLGIDDPLVSMSDMRDYFANLGSLNQNYTDIQTYLSNN